MIQMTVICDVEGCAEDATVEVDGRLRLNAGKRPPRWIAVEFRLCPEHETAHDNSYGSPKLGATRKTEVQP